MQNIMLIASFEINDKSLMGDWKKMSDGITESLKSVDGCYFRESAIGEDGKIYCILKWENIEKRNAFMKTMQDDSFKDQMVEFSRIVNMETMKSEVLNII